MDIARAQANRELLRAQERVYFEHVVGLPSVKRPPLRPLPNPDAEPQGHRQLVIEMLRERNGNTCYLCGKELPRSPAVEHIIPLVHGGENRLCNVALACPRCNARKGDQFVSVDVRTRRPYYHFPARSGRVGHPPPPTPVVSPEPA